MAGQRWNAQKATTHFCVSHSHVLHHKMWLMWALNRRSFNSFVSLTIAEWPNAVDTVCKYYQQQEHLFHQKLIIYPRLRWLQKQESLYWNTFTGSPARSLHRHRHPPRRRGPGGILPHRQSHDRLPAQVCLFSSLLKCATSYLSTRTGVYLG